MAFYCQHFAEPRLKHYLDHCNGDQAKAAELYRWNNAISSALWDGLGYFELRELGRDKDGPGQHRQPYLDVHRAKSRVSGNGMP